MVFFVAFGFVQGCSRNIDGIRTATEISRRNNNTITSNNPENTSYIYNSENKSENDNRRMVTCPHCGGRGYTNCALCNGSGLKTVPVDVYGRSDSEIPTDVVERTVPCETITNRCWWCDGTGQVTDQQAGEMHEDQARADEMLREWTRTEDAIKEECEANNGYYIIGMPPIGTFHKGIPGKCVGRLSN